MPHTINAFDHVMALLYSEWRWEQERRRAEIIAQNKQAAFSARREAENAIADPITKYRVGVAADMACQVIEH